MNVERLHRVARLISEELESAQTLPQLQQLRDSLQTVVGTPTDPSAQANLSEARTHLQQTLPNAESNTWTPADRQTLDDIGISEVVGQRLLDRIEEILARNQMTPSVALSEIDPIFERLDEVAKGLGTVLEGFSFFGIGSDDIVNDYEVGVEIPRAEVKNSLPALGEEFVDLQNVLAPFELLAGEGAEDFKVRAIASSDFQVYLDAAPGVTMFVLLALNLVLDAIRKVSNIREMRNKAEENELPDISTQLEEVAKTQILTELARGANELAQKAVDSGAYAGNANDLEARVNVSLKQLAKRIDAGYTVNVRVPPPPDEPQPDEEGKVDQAALAAYNQAVEMQSLAARVKRLEIAGGKRILELPEGDGPETPAGSDGPPQ